ncbi:MAG: hypothetical protein HZB15_18395 [Actinobacteria bacterium]|nr:hypothetical protein [Actinomycetota bacterium]
MEVRFVEQGSLAGDSSVRWYATRAARPEAATYLRLFSYRNDVLAGPLGCLLPEPARESTLDNGTPVCLDERHESDPYGRVMIDRAPYAVIIEGNATDDELLVAARYVESSTTDDGFEVAPA